MKRVDQYKYMFPKSSNLISCGYNNYQSGVSLEWHSHEGLEFTYVLSGRTVWEDEKKQVYPLETGMLSFMKEGIKHHGIDNITYPCEMIWIVFKDQEGLQSDLPLCDPGCYMFSDDLSRALHELKENLIHQNYPEVIHRQLIALQVQRVILMSFYASARGRKESGGLEFLKIKNYIDENFQEQVTGQLLCQLFHKSSVSITKSFHQNVGMTPVAYLTSIRLKYAEELLKSCHKSITDIALESGFSSAQYFSFVFHNYYGKCPSEYRRIKGEKSEGDHL